MATFTAKMELRRTSRPIRIVTLSGRLDAAGLPILQECLSAIRPEKDLRVLFNMRELGFVGSAGIGLFLSFVEEVRDAGGDARFINIPESILSILSLLNVLEFLTQSGSAEEAIEELSV